MKPITPVKTRYLSLAKSARKFCLTRCEDGAKSVRLCEDTECPLHPYRFAKNPNRVGIGGGKRGVLVENRHSSEVVHLEKKTLEEFAIGASFLNTGASGGEIRPILEGQGKIQISRTGNQISIKVTTES